MFVYQGVLGVGEDSVFTVWFKALTNGTLVNNVTARSNVTDDTPGNNTTFMSAVKPHSLLLLLILVIVI